MSENFDAAVNELAKDAGVAEKDAQALMNAIKTKAKNKELGGDFIKSLMEGAELAGNNACGGGSNACGGASDILV